MEKMTIEQALSGGYKLCGYADKEYQTLMSIDMVDADNFQFGGRILIAEIIGKSPSIGAERIKDILSDEIASDWANDTYDDTDDVYNLVMQMDFSDVSDRINKALQHKEYFALTDIELIP